MISGFWKDFPILISYHFGVTLANSFAMKSYKVVPYTSYDWGCDNPISDLING